jgi:ABC-2 type transport system permease protein
MTAFRLFFRYAGVTLRSQMQYRLSFLMLAVGHFFGTAFELVGIWALFARFKMLGEWQFAEVALFYGMINIGFALAEGFGRGFDIFAQMVKSGDFDRLLLRPRGTALQVAAQEVQLFRLGRLFQGLVVLLWAANSLSVQWNFARIGLLLFAVTSAGALFYGLFVLQATLSFWSTETLEIMNTVTYGGTETGQYPLSIYWKWFRRFFTFVIPLACVNYFPVLAIIEKPDPLDSPVWFQWISPVVGFIFLWVSLQIWQIGVRRYRSTGS